MSRIFLAEDLALEREVVIKVVSPHLVDETVLTRFRQEVLQTARLQHPTIVSVFELGTIDGDGEQPLPFYVMPYVRGESLRSRLKHDGALSVAATVRILRNVLDALVHAHAHGVLHRDIKPENIFLSGTNAVLADFGVAKAIAGPAQHVSITSPGTSIGTPAYMAPQQIAGEEGLDPRADLYAVGVVAFEMLTGRLPWDSSNTSEMIAAKARNAISPLLSLRPDAPAPLASMVEHCLEWDPSRRPPTAEVLLRALEQIELSGTPSGQAPAYGRVPPRHFHVPVYVAVLVMAVVVALAALAWPLNPSASRPLGLQIVRLAVLSPSVDNQENADETVGHQIYHSFIRRLYPLPGLELINESMIARMEQLRIPRMQVEEKLLGEGYDSVLSMEALRRPDGRIGIVLLLRRLGSGAVEAIGDSLLLDSLSLLPVDSAGVLADTLARRVAERFSLVTVRRNVRETASSDAALARERGRREASGRSPAGIRNAIASYREAIRLDPGYAQAYADLAETLALAVFYRYGTGVSPYETAAEAMSHAERAIGLQPDMAEGYTAKGYISMITGAPVDSVRKHYTRARELHPENPNARTWHIGILALDGLFEQAIDSLELLLRLDPGSPSKRISTAVYSLPLRRFDDVVMNAAAARQSQPDLPFAAALEIWGRVLRKSAANDCIKLEAAPYWGARAACLEHVRGRTAGTVALDSLMQQATRNASDTGFDVSLYASELAMYSAVHGEAGAAALWLRKAFQESPMGVDSRFLRTGIFPQELVTLSDSLRRSAWQSVVARAQALRP